MTVELHDLILGIALQTVAVADSAVSSLCALYAAGASGGLDPGPLAAGAAAAGAAGAAAAAGGDRGEGDGDGDGDGEGAGPDGDNNDDDCI